MGAALAASVQSDRQRNFDKSEYRIMNNEYPPAMHRELAERND
jgi:hypothetical protein